jgi:hypothetical protein
MVELPLPSRLSATSNIELFQIAAKVNIAAEHVKTA